MECGQIGLEGSKIGKKENTIIPIQLSTNDQLFTEIADMNISVIPRYLREKSLEIQCTHFHCDCDVIALYNSRPKDSTCSISDLTQFVRKVGTIQELYDSLQVHLTVANVVTSVTNSNEFGERWQRERELLEGDNIIDTLRDSLWQEVRREWNDDNAYAYVDNDNDNDNCFELWVFLQLTCSVTWLILFITLFCTPLSTMVLNQRIMKQFEESFYL